MMILVNEMEKAKNIRDKDFKMFLQILTPFAPHVTEEIWHNLNGSYASNSIKTTIHKNGWPKWDKNKIVDSFIKIAVQVNGKVRTEILLDNDLSDEEIKEIALKDKNVISWMEGKEIKRFIYVKGRIINIVV
jgi:leucyl-tRNA synthetase